MTTYTTPHSLPILESTDKIAADGDGLREDINALSQATNTAIGAEGGRAETSAKNYADTQAAAAETSAKNYADTQAAGAETSAKSYADGQVAPDRARLASIEKTAVFDSQRNATMPYMHAFTDQDDLLGLGVRYDGVVEAPAGIETPSAGMPLDSINGTSYAITDGEYFSDIDLGEDGCIQDDVIVRWAARMGVVPVPTRRTAIALTHASGGSQVDTRTAVQQRIPLKLGADAVIEEIHIRNYEDRSGFAHTGALSFAGLGWGESALGSFGQLTGNFAAAPAMLAGAFTTAADGSEYVVGGLNIPIKANTDYLLSYGYTCADQPNHAGVGGSWTNTTPGNFAAATDALTLGKFAPLDVWLVIRTTAPIVGWNWDSLGCGVASEIPGYYSVPMIHGRMHGTIPLMYTNSGSAMTSWTNPNVVKYTKWAGLAKPDALVIGLGKNDFLTTTDLAVLRTRFETLYPVITGATTKNLYLATVMPSADESDAIGAAERGWNEILLTEQLGNAVNVFDLRRALTGPAGGLNPAYDSGDGVHLNKRGYAAAAAVIPSLTR